MTWEPKQPLAIRGEYVEPDTGRIRYIDSVDHRVHVDGDHDSGDYDGTIGVREELLAPWLSTEEQEAMQEVIEAARLLSTVAADYGDVLSSAELAWQMENLRGALASLDALRRSQQG